MRVKHKDAKKSNSDTSMSLSHWQKTYFPHKKYLNYEFYDVPEIFDLFEIDENTGKLTYVKSGFASEIKNLVKKYPRKYVDKQHDSKYLDEYLMPKNVDYSGLSFLKRPKNNWSKILKLNTIYKRISKVAFKIIISVIIGVLILIIWALFEEQIVEYFKN